MKLSKYTDPELGPVLSALAFFLILLIAYLVLILPFTANAGAVGGAIGVLSTLLGLALQQRGKLHDRRRRK